MVVRTTSRTLRGVCSAVSPVSPSGKLADPGRSMAIAGQRYGLPGDDHPVDAATYLGSTRAGLTGRWPAARPAREKIPGYLLGFSARCGSGTFVARSAKS